MRRWLMLGLALGLGCGMGKNAPPPEGEVVIGEYGSMTGSEAVFGQSTDNGVHMAVDELNARGGIGGKKIRLVAYDDQGRTSEVGTAVTRLVTSNQVLAVIGEVASSLSIAGGQICQRHHTPMVSPSSTNPKVTEQGDYIFRVCFIDPFQGLVMAKFAVMPKDGAKDAHGLGITRVAMLVDQRQAYSQGLARDFESALVRLGGQVPIKVTYQGGDQDFSAQLTQIKNAAPEAIYVPGYYTDIANIAKQARAIGIPKSVPLLGGDGWESVQQIGGDAIDGSYYSNHYAPEDPRPEVQQFVTTYKRRFGRVPDSLAALGYDSMMLIADAAERGHAIPRATLAEERTALRDALAQTTGFQGVAGKIAMDADRNARKPAVVLRIDSATKTVPFQTSIAPQ
jgi:branched-chain amino acid transport system substrate-binding protein